MHGQTRLSPEGGLNVSLGGKFGRGWHRHNRQSGRRAEAAPAGHWPCSRCVGRKVAAANVRLCQSAQCAHKVSKCKCARTSCTHKSKLHLHKGKKHNCTNATNTLRNAHASQKHEHVRIIVKITTVAEAVKCGLAHAQPKQAEA